MSGLVFRSVLVGLLIPLAACSRDTIQGRVTNMRGEALPGVTVVVAGTSTQDLTDGLGRYRIAVPAGSDALVFSKSGYTSAKVPLTAGRGAPPEAVLWVLPTNAGVYDAGQHHYRESTWVVPKQHYLKDGSAAFGVELPAGVLESTTEPFLLAHRTPRYNAQLSRLVPEAARLQGIEEKSIEVWVEAGTMAVGLEPLDPAESLLLRVQIGRPLEPGVYGIHWGAMEGYTTLDNRVFLFRVPEPPEADAAGETEAAPADSEGEPAETDTPKKDEGAPTAEDASPPKPEADESDILEPVDENPAQP